MLRVSEIYLSVQGEGPHVGTPTVFVRFAGCNLRCPGWPCDTPHAIDPSKYRQEWKFLSPEEVAITIRDIAAGARVRVCFTGGEPLLQPSADLKELAELLCTSHAIDCFSNGTIEYPSWMQNEDIVFVMDWKLPGSGEISTASARFENMRGFCSDDTIKFTIANREDFEHAIAIWKEVASQTDAQFYAGVVWGKLDNATLVEWMLKAKLPWKLNVQVHNHIWPREQRGI